MIATYPGSKPMILKAQHARDLMTPNPVSIRSNATVREALAMLIDRDVAAAPVIDEAGRAVGVVSVTDILIHEREAVIPPGLSAEMSALIAIPAELRDSFQPEFADPTLVDQVMTPGVFAVPTEYPSERVVADLLQLHVHRLFIVDGHGDIVGVITTTDILRHLTS